MKKLSMYSYLTIGFGLAAFSGGAWAVSAQCTSAMQFGIPACGGNAACIASIQANHPECFGSSSSTAASSQAIQSTVVQQMLAISKAVGMRTAASQSRPAHKKVADSAVQQIGMAAGNSPAQWNFWGSFNSDKNKYDRGGYVGNGATRNNKYDINATNAVIGGDCQLNPTVAAGLSAAFDHSSGTGESFAGGVSNGVASLGTNGYTVAPYIGWQIDQNLSLDASLGFGRANTSTDSTTAKIDRLFYGANLSYTRWYDNWQVTGKGSYLHGEEKSGNLTSPVSGVLSGTAVTNKIDQLNFGARAGYLMNDNAMPYFGLTYSNDISRSTTLAAAAQLGNELGKNAFVWALGVDFFSIQNSITGGISYSHETGRTYAKNNSLMANINFRF